ncbi:MAG: sigma-70 family RNA polymerase sigma factor [Firmicutes bacterium]|nr:sigma-70 family RNA polymerase sigma factor [Bacillota bacterium]
MAAMDAAERKLMARVAAGDEDAFAGLYDAYAGRIYRYALVRTGRRDLAEEAVQETLLAAWRGASSWRGESALSTWLFGICHRCLGHLLRKLEPPPLGPAPAVGAQADQRDGVHECGDDPWPNQDRSLTLRRALAAMDEGLRETLFLVYYLDLSVTEAAQVMAVPVGTVKSRLHTARRRLAAMLQDGGAEHAH